MLSNACVVGVLGSSSFSSQVIWFVSFAQLTFENLSNSPELTSSTHICLARFIDLTRSRADKTSRFFKKPVEYAMSLYAYYQCSRCLQPYFAGQKSCQAGVRARCLLSSKRWLITRALAQQRRAAKAMRLTRRSSSADRVGACRIDARNDVCLTR